MAGLAVPRAIDRSDARGCRPRCRSPTRRRSVPAAPDRLAPKQSATLLAARQRPRPGARMCGGEVSWRALPEGSPTMETSACRLEHAMTRRSALAEQLHFPGGGLDFVRRG